MRVGSLELRGRWGPGGRRSLGPRKKERQAELRGALRELGSSSISVTILNTIPKKVTI